MRAQKSTALLILATASLFIVASRGLADSGARSLQPGRALEPLEVRDARGVAPSQITGAGARYILQLDDPPLASYRGDIGGLQATSPRALGQPKLDLRSPASRAYVQYLESRQAAVLEAVATAIGRQPAVTYRYRVALNGMAIALTPEEARRVRSLPGVRAVTRDVMRQLLTEVSPGFIGADTAWASLGGQGSAGEGIVVGVIDSGIWPEHASVSDPDPGAKAYPAPPTVPGSNGILAGDGSTCSFGDITFNPDDAPFTCNNKLIGAYDFTDTYKSVVGLIPTEFDSARDSNGHGTHTLTTAAGNGGVSATLLGVPRGTVSGVAPRAHVIAYKGCGLQGCFSSDTSASVDQAILDGVDVINYSISGGNDPYNDVVSEAFLNAYAAGTLVSASAGNSGPGSDTVGHREPWVLTVGASTSDRHFLSIVTLEADNNDTLVVEGTTVTGGITTATSVIFPPAGKEQCEDTPGGADPFAPGTFSGEIVICDRGGFARVAKSFNVSEGGAGGMLLVNLVPQGLATDNHFIPSVHLEDTDGAAIKAFMASHTGVAATFTAGTATTVMGDVMASFSSRGGPQSPLGISKPDVTAPGVQILAGMTPNPENAEVGLPGQLFQSIQGTSMSAPHAAGAAALIKDAHPSWSPAWIKSALMTTAKKTVYKEDGVTPADPLDMGAGRIDLTKALDPGLGLDETVANYEDADPALGGDPATLNNPSLAQANCLYRCRLFRTVRNLGPSPTGWNAMISASQNITGTVSPPGFTLPGGGTQVLEIKMDATGTTPGQVGSGELTLTEQSSAFSPAHLPIILRTVDTTDRLQLTKTVDDPETFTGARRTYYSTLTSASTQTNTWLWQDSIPDGVTYVSSSAWASSGNPPSFAGSVLTWTGQLQGQGIGVGPGTSPAGYLPLSTFFPPLPLLTDADNGGWIFSGLDFLFRGTHYTQAIMSVNGVFEVGAASGLSASGLNQFFPDPNIPNNALAPLWTDLNTDPSTGGGGELYAGNLTDGTNSWHVFEWSNVPSFGDPSSAFTFQIWIQQGTVEDISFVYGALSSPLPAQLTVGAENNDATLGNNYHYNGTGPLPILGTDLKVFPIPGGSVDFSFQVDVGQDIGKILNTVEATDGTQTIEAAALMDVNEVCAPNTVQNETFSDAQSRTGCPLTVNGLIIAPTGSGHLNGNLIKVIELSVEAGGEATFNN